MHNNNIATILNLQATIISSINHLLADNSHLIHTMNYFFVPFRHN